MKKFGFITTTDKIYREEQIPFTLEKLRQILDKYSNSGIDLDEAYSFLKDPERKEEISLYLGYKEVPFDELGDDEEYHLVRVD